MEGSGVYILSKSFENVKRYQHRGSDNSFMYRYFCSPLAETLVQNFVPKWVAPNLLTLLGTVSSAIGYLAIHYFSPDLKSACPRWSWALLGLCTFIYQTMDNMDGKQARRTGTSSALGLLLDHGADALNIVLNAMNAMALLQVGDSPYLCLGIWCTSASPFFMATWEEYHTGVMDLGLINGPTDGVLTLTACYFLSACVTDYSALWGFELLPGCPLKVATIAAYAVWASITLLTNVRAVLAACGSPGDARSTWRGALLQLLPFGLSLLAGAAWLLPIHREEPGTGASVFFRSPRAVFWLFGFVFLLLVGQLQLAHICGDVYKPFTRSLLVTSALLSVQTALSALLGEAALSWPMLWCCLALLAAAWLHFVWHTAQDLARILDISVFTIGVPNPKAS